MIIREIINSSITIVPKRFLRTKVYKSWPNDWVPFHWSRPEFTPGWQCPEDLVPRREANPDELQENVKYSAKLRDLPTEHPMKKFFSLNHASIPDQTKTTINEIINQLGVVHRVDFANSLEAKIINATFKIRQVLEDIELACQKREGVRYSGQLRLGVNKLRHRRYKHLCELGEISSERYQRIIKILDLEPKENKINVTPVKPYRKRQMRILAIEYSRKIVEDKVANYIKSLESEKIEFEKQKQETMKWIEEQEKALSKS